MKKILLNNRGLFTILLFVIGLFLLTSYPADNRPNIPQTLLREIKPNPEPLVDSLTPYKRYKFIYDSLQNIEQTKKWELIDVGEGGGSIFFGINKRVECDSCNELHVFAPTDKKEFKTKYFFTLQNFTLNHDASFLIEKGKYMIKYVVWGDRKGDMRSGDIMTKEVKVRFTSNFPPFKKNETALLIPISKNAYNFWKIFIWFVFTPLLIILAWISFILPIKVLYRVAMGNCFVEKNVSNLRLSGWMLIITTLFPIVLSFIVKLIMGPALPKEIYFPYWLYLTDNKGWLIGGICLLIISNAFKQGMILKQEQELTV